MTIEDTVRRFERRQGYDLIDYAEIALPIYRLVVDSVTMAHREIPPIKEFVMRTVSTGLDRASDVGSFLGLDEGTVEGTFRQLLDDRYVEQLDQSDQYEMLERGQVVLTKARESSPQDEMLVFLYDRLLRRPIRLPVDQLMPPSGVNPNRMIEIRPYPADGPDISDLQLADVLQVLEQQAGGRAAFGRDLLRLKRIVRRVRLYRPGIGLVYKKVRSSEIQIAFVVDDSRHDALEHSFAISGGPKKMGFIQSIDESSTAAELRRYLGPEVQALLPDQAALDEKRLAVSVARLKQQSAKARADRLGGIDVPEAAAEKVTFNSASVALEKAELELRAFPARPVLPFEIPELLREALTSSEHSIFIASRSLNRAIVDSIFMNRLTHALQRNVRVVILLTDALGSGNIGPAAELEKLRRKFPNLELVRGRRAAFDHLVSDKSFALISNRPMLGNQSKARTFQHTVGYLLQSQELVAAFTDRIRSSANGGPQGGHRR